MIKSNGILDFSSALLKIFIMFAALWFCVANAPAPCRDIAEPKSSGDIDVGISLKDMQGGGSLVFEVTRPLNYFALKTGADLIFEAACSEASSDCFPKKFKIDCTFLEDWSSEEKSIIGEVAPENTAARAAAGPAPSTAGESPVEDGAEDGQMQEKAEPVDTSTESLKRPLISLNKDASDKCSEKGLLYGPDFKAKARSADGREGFMTFKFKMVPAPGYLSCKKSEYNKCSEKYK